MRNSKRYVTLMKNNELFFKGYIDLNLHISLKDLEQKERPVRSFSFSKFTLGTTKINLSKFASTNELKIINEYDPLIDGKYYTNSFNIEYNKENGYFIQILEGTDLLLETYVKKAAFKKSDFHFSEGSKLDIPIANQFQQIILNLTNNPILDLWVNDVPDHIRDNNKIKFEEYLSEGHIYEDGKVLKTVGQFNLNQVINNGSTTMYRTSDKKYFKYDYQPGILTFKIDDQKIYEFRGDFSEVVSPIQYWADKRSYINLKLHSFKGKFIRHGKENPVEVSPKINELNRSVVIKDAFNVEYHLNNETNDIGTSSLDDLIGLANLKEQFTSFSNFMNYNKWRKGSLKSAGDINIGLHMAFLGNPGTGKTTVAKRIGSLLRDLDMLKKGHVVVAERSTLVGKYIGHTAIKVKEVVESALDGVLFIDEAYSLYSESPNDYGHEAISALITEMENNKENLVVIFAGYNDKMQNLFDMNEGLKSRISYRFMFDDYTSEEKVEILKSIIIENNFIIKDEVLHQAEITLSEISQILDNPIKNRYEFGNARGVRKFFEYMVQNIADRIAIESAGYTIPLATKDQINEFLLEDLDNIKEKFIPNGQVEETGTIGFTSLV